MAEGRKCRNCEKAAAMKEEEFLGITEKYLDREESRNNLVPLEESVKRLALCRSCGYLQGGVSCPFCSSLVPGMVRLKDKKCHRPEGGLW